MTFHIITIFPEIFSAQGGSASGRNSCSYFDKGIIKRAQKKGIIKIKIHNLRDWTADKHKTVDDAPYGGGAGMVMKVEPIVKALQALRLQITNYKLQINSKVQNPKSKTILLSAKGKRWNQQLAKKYSKLDNIILICGRYEGVDERVKKFVDEEISIGDYVLTGGEIPAMAIVDSITRLLPGALGNAESAKRESHSKKGILEYPQYTRPEVFYVTHNMGHVTKAHFQRETNPPLLTKERGRVRFKKNPKSKIQNPNSKKYRVPKVLLSGNHKKIEEWRKKHMRRVSY